MSSGAPPLIVIGAGGHAKVVVSVARALGRKVTALLDDSEAKWGTEVASVPVRGPIQELAMRADGEVIIAIGDNSARQRLSQDLANHCRWATLTHPSAFVHHSVALGAGTVIMAGAIIQPDANLGCHVIVNTAACIDHECQVGDYVHVGPKVGLCGGVSIGEGVLLGVGANATPGISVGEWAIVGAGSTVTRSIPPRVTAVGTPAVPVTRPAAGLLDP